MKTVGERIIFLREEREISQKELAKKIGITAASLSRYENNIYDPKGSIIYSIAKCLNTSADFLLGLTPNYNLIPNKQLITPEEYLFLQKYRKLSNDNKARVDERITTLLDLQQTSPLTSHTQNRIL